jgi:outer membrane immunogenic protein
MKKTLVGAAALVALASAALAADPPDRRAPPPVPAVPVEASYPALWTGFYAGVSAGAAIDGSTSRLRPAPDGFAGTLSNEDLAFLSRRGRSDEVGFTGGAQAGYNFQVSRFVFGGEADLSYLGLDSRSGTSATVPGTFAGGAVAASQAANGGQPLAYETRGRQAVDWYGTVRGRVGYAFGNVLAYGTGGLAYGDVRTYNAAYTAPGDFFGPFPFLYGARTSETRLGWTAGGGVEYALSRNLSLRGEYLHVDLGDKTAVLPAQGGASAVAPGSALLARDETRFDVVRAGLNYRW